MPQTDLMVELLRQDLSAPVVLLEQVVQYLNDHYGYMGENLADFFREKFPALEDYQVDLAFSPQYTPAEHHRLNYIPALGGKHLSPSQLAEVKRRLYESGLQTEMRTPDGLVCVTLPVHEVFIDRYVNLLKLDQPLPPAIYEEILASVPQASHNEMNLLGREDVWQSPERQQMLIAFLRAFKAGNRFSTVKASFLTNFVRTYRPAHLFDLHRQFDSLIQSCQNDMDNVSGRGFHDEYLKALNEGNNLVKGAEKDIWAHYKHMSDLAAQLKEDFLRIEQVAPEIVAQARQHLPV